MVSTVCAPVSASLFVDGFAIYCSSSRIIVIERQLELVLNKLFLWSTTHGFTLSNLVVLYALLPKILHSL